MTWKNIKYKDVKDIYEINEKGSVRNRYTLKKIKPHMGGHGYMQVKLARHEKIAPITVHSLVAYTFLDYDKNIIDPEVNHKVANSIEINNTLENLEIVSRKDNTKHAVENNLYEKLEDRYNASLTNDDVHNICKMIESGVSYKQIRKNIGPKLSRDVLKKIKSRDNYREISKFYDFSNAIPFKYSDKLRNEIRTLLVNGVTNINDVLNAVKLEKNKSTITLVKNQRKQVKKGSTTIENDHIFLDEDW